MVHVSCDISVNRKSKIYIIRLFYTFFIHFAFPAPSTTAMIYYLLCGLLGSRSFLCQLLVCSQKSQLLNNLYDGPIQNSLIPALGSMEAHLMVSFFDKMLINSLSKNIIADQIHRHICTIKQKNPLQNKHLLA